MSAPPVRSTFVTVLAWIFIGIAGFACLISLLQNIMLELVFQPALAQAATQAPPADMPAPFAFLTAHIAWFFRAFLLLALFMLTAAIGLLRRKNWARQLFIALMAFAIVYQLGGLAVQWWVFHTMQDVMVSPPNAPADFARGMATMMTVMRVFGVLLALGLSSLSGWLIYRLRLPAVRQEFGRP
jgi:hypothetical protein